MKLRSVIKIERINENTFEVSVRGNSTTTHQVELSDEYFDNLTSQKATKEELIRRAFEFLLERESNSMILSEFELPTIQKYFPDFEEEIKKTFIR